MSKKYLKAIFVFLSLALCPAFLYISCGVREEEALSTVPAKLTDGEIMDLYEQAGYAYGWFEIYNMEYLRQDPKEIEGVKYYKVKDGQIHNMDSLTEYLRQFFSETVIGELLKDSGQPPKFLDIDGELYTSARVRSANRYAGEETYRIVRSESGELINLLVDVEMLDENMESVGVQEYTFVMKQIDGKWIFENFASVR